MMNDETRERLSAYLDGALPEDQRRELETRLASSEELRGELEELRAVSRAVRELPKAPPPPGFLARLEARRARGDAPRPDRAWVFLPPAARPFALALSCGIVALWIWQDTVVRIPIPVPAPPAAQLETAASAPISQLNVSAAAAGSLKSSADALDQKSALGLESVRGSGGSGLAAHAKAKGYAIGEESAGAALQPSGTAMTEEERSARNIEMFADLEKQKDKLAVSGGPDRAAQSAAMLRRAGLIPAEPTPEPVLSARAPRMMKKAEASALSDDGSLASASGASAAPPAASAAPAPSAAPESGRPAPDGALVFTEPRGFASAWVLLGFPNDPPVVNFARQRAVLIKPSATKIVSIKPGPDAIAVVYRSLGPDETADPANDRFAPIPQEPKAVVITDSTSR